MRIAVLCLSVLALLGVVVPAKAGDYYDNGYRTSGYRNVYYSSSCCYKKVVRHETTSRYVRVDEDRSYYRGGYYDRPYRSSSYYDRPRRYVDDNYYAPRRYVGYDNGGYSGYSDYSNYSGYSGNPGYSAYGQSCYRQRVRVEDGRGGWVWSSTRVCN